MSEATQVAPSGNPAQGRQPVDPPVADNGVDRTIVAAFLRLSPLERLRRHDRHLLSVRRLRAGLRR